MPQNFETVLFDITDRLSQAATPDESWAAVVAASRMVGATALNAGAVTVDTREAIWSRSTMTQEWLTEYTAQKLYEVDPLVYGIQARCLPELHPAGHPLAGMVPDPRFEILRTRLVHYGYAWFWGHLWREPTHENIVVMATQDDPRDMFGPNTACLIRTVSALMAARLSAPQEVDALYGERTGYKPLSAREKDVMHYLAQGLDNVGIAHKLGIAEVTVRMHLRSVRKKMCATTREQALALALLRGAFEA